MKNAKTVSVFNNNSNNGGSMKLQLDTSKIVTAEKARKFNRFMKRQARNAKPMPKKEAVMKKRTSSVNKVTALILESKKLEKRASNVGTMNSDRKTAFLEKLLVISEKLQSIPASKELREKISARLIALSLITSKLNYELNSIYEEDCLVEESSEFFSEEDGFSLTSIEEELREQDSKTYAKALLKIYTKDIAELYGDETVARCSEDSEYCELITAHMKDKSEKLYFKTEGEIKVRFQWWNAAAQEWFWVSKSAAKIKSAPGESAPVEIQEQCEMIQATLSESKTFSATGYSFEDLIDEDGELISCSKISKNKEGETISIGTGVTRVKAMAEQFVSKFLFRSFSSSDCMPGSIRVVLEHPNFGKFIGFDSDNAVNEAGFPVKQYVQLDDGIVAVKPSDRFELEGCDYEESSIKKEIQKDVSRRVSMATAYRLDATTEKRAAKAADKADERRVKVDSALKTAKDEAFLEANKEILEIITKASDYAETWGVSAGINILKGCAFTAAEMLPVIYASKMRVNKQIYFVIKNMTKYNNYQTKQEVAKFDVTEIKGLINNLNSAHAETKNDSLRTVLADKTLAKVVLDVAMSGHYIQDKAVYFMVKKYAVAA